MAQTHRGRGGGGQKEGRTEKSTHLLYNLGERGGALTETGGEGWTEGRGFPCAYGSRFIYSRLTTIMKTLTLTLPFSIS